MAMFAQACEFVDGPAFAGWATHDTVGRGRLRLAGLAGLLLIEVLALSLRYDARSIWEGVRGLSQALGSATAASPGIGGVESPGGWIVRAFEHSGTALKMGIAAAAATLLFGGHTLRKGLGRAAAASPGRRAWPMFLAHLAAVA